MFEEQVIDKIATSELLDKVRSIIDSDHRLVQISCTKIGEQFMLDYSFDKDHKFYGIRIEIPVKDARLPSVSAVCPPAFLYENEIHDLFGIKIDNISVDFKGKFYRIEKEAPFSEDDL